MFWVSDGSKAQFSYTCPMLTECIEALHTLVGPDGGVELHAVAAVDVLHALLVPPRHAEGHHALRLHQARLRTFGSEMALVTGSVGFARMQDELHALTGPATPHVKQPCVQAAPDMPAEDEA